MFRQAISTAAHHSTEKKERARFEKIIARANHALVTIQEKTNSKQELHSFFNKHGEPMTLEQHAMNQTNELLRAVMAFDYAALRSTLVNSVGLVSMAARKRASRAAADGLYDMFQKFMLSNVVMHAELMSIFKSKENRIMPENGIIILQYLKKILTLFKAKIQLSEFNYYLSKGVAPEEARYKAEISMTYRPALTDRLYLLLGQHLEEHDLNTFTNRYNFTIRTLLKVERTLEFQLGVSMSSIKRQASNGASVNDNKHPMEATTRRRPGF